MTTRTESRIRTAATIALVCVLAQGILTAALWASSQIFTLVHLMTSVTVFVVITGVLLLNLHPRVRGLWLLLLVWWFIEYANQAPSLLRGELFDASTLLNGFLGWSTLGIPVFVVTVMIQDWWRIRERRVPILLIALLWVSLFVLGKHLGGIPWDVLPPPLPMWVIYWLSVGLVLGSVGLIGVMLWLLRRDMRSMKASEM